MKHESMVCLRKTGYQTGYWYSMCPHVKYVYKMGPHCETTPFTTAGASAAAGASVPPPLDNLPIGSCSKFSNFQMLVTVGDHWGG